MNRRLIAVFAGLALVACGGVDSELDGHWSGTTKLTMRRETTAYPGELSIVVEDDSADVSHLCVDGSGSLKAQGSGRNLLWTGELTCRPVSLPGCGFVVFTFTTGALVLNEDRTLRVSGGGDAAGCGQSSVFDIVFNGTK